tara:strand:+ start:826 stop:1551 length:726 start_codon:yes stop_codon:yes gene_type:complete
MRNIVKKMTINYSPNFDLKKRASSKIKYLIFHYTGMKSDKSAIKRLTSTNSRVSCHYYIDMGGSIIQMVPDRYIAWHAGKSSWGKDKNLNKNSIGIEISNPGHGHGYKKFKKIQIESLINLSKKLIKKYSLKNKNILGHSDIAPLRKKDPGENFPWYSIYKKKIGIWHSYKLKTKNPCDDEVSKKLYKKFFINLKKFGYSVQHKNCLDKKKIIKSFQRRFRPNLVSGKIDHETYGILKSLN